MAVDATRVANLSELRSAAVGAAHACYPRYSGFEVVAAVQRIDGKVYGGANVEVVNLSLTKHAEETAVLAAIADGALLLGDKWLAAVYTRGAMPCGSCRQFLWEWAVPSAVCVTDLSFGDQDELPQQYKLSELLPAPFDPDVLPDRRHRSG